MHALVRVKAPTCVRLLLSRVQRRDSTRAKSPIAVYLCNFIVVGKQHHIGSAVRWHLQAQETPVPDQCPSAIEEMVVGKVHRARKLLPCVRAEFDKLIGPLRLARGAVECAVARKRIRPVLRCAGIEEIVVTCT